MLALKTWITEAPWIAQTSRAPGRVATTPSRPKARRPPTALLRQPGSKASQYAVIFDETWIRVNMQMPDNKRLPMVISVCLVLLGFSQWFDPSESPIRWKWLQDTANSLLGKHGYAKLLIVSGGIYLFWNLFDIFKNSFRFERQRLDAQPMGGRLAESGEDRRTSSDDLGRQ